MHSFELFIVLLHNLSPPNDQRPVPLARVPVQVTNNRFLQLRVHLLKHDVISSFAIQIEPPRRLLEDYHTHTFAGGVKGELGQEGEGFAKRGRHVCVGEGQGGVETGDEDEPDRRGT